AKVESGRVMVTGGVSVNDVMMRFLREKGYDPVVPAEALYFEAFGAALYALRMPEAGIHLSEEALFVHRGGSFPRERPLSESVPMVRFCPSERAEASDGDECLVGLDAGSTTTKAVLYRRRDGRILASHYGRTKGDPVNAARECYREILRQVSGRRVRIIGLTTTGSGRQITGLHAGVPQALIINEIIAHGAAAAKFCPEVETIFEIGGQDAKYIRFSADPRHKVPIDYAMNEACSAGTGSFLEEAAKESLNLDVTEIADAALAARSPLRFGEQCAAFIGSDIKVAIQEGADLRDIAAGLVYSILLNYLNRVVGNRKTSGTILMQGGVCYNRAVPVAAAAILGRPIVVPPEPGLMGAYGVCLAAERVLAEGLAKPAEVDLEAIAARECRAEKTFRCPGDPACDLKCEVLSIRVGGRLFPFGGACNRYFLAREGRKFDAAEFDSVARRQKLVFETCAAEPLPPGSAPTVGIPGAFMDNTLYPYYSTFFRELGFRVEIGRQPKEEGVRRRGAAFCFPVEIAHGLIQDLLERNVDYLFLPHVRGMFVENHDGQNSVVCPFVQGAPYYLATAFGLKERLKPRLLAPFVDFSDGIERAGRDMAAMADDLGVSRYAIRRACRAAAARQAEFGARLKEIGSEALDRLEKDPSARAVVLFGRPYNAFSQLAARGIPRKFASRGIAIIPFDALPYSRERSVPGMYWSTGQMILRSAQYVKRHPQLFGVFLTNFSCGPDSFIVEYFRRIMGRKPSLTLEIDSHTAGAGLDTRVEAYLDIVDAWRRSGVRLDESDAPEAILEGWDPPSAAEVLASGGSSRSSHRAARGGRRSGRLPAAEGREATGDARGAAEGYTSAARSATAGPVAAAATGAPDARTGAPVQGEAQVPASGAPLWERTSGRAAPAPGGDGFHPAVVRHLPGGRTVVVTSSGESLPLTDPRVEVIYCSMGDLSTEAVSAATRSVGIRSRALPEATAAELMLGKQHAGCKECVPHHITLGQYLALGRPPENQVWLWIMGHAEGPCRFGQYAKAMQLVINDLRIPNVAVLTLSCTNGYAGLGMTFTRRAWIGMTIADYMDDIRSTLRALAADREAAMREFREVWAGLISRLEKAETYTSSAVPRTFFAPLDAPVREALREAAARLSRIPLKKPLSEADFVAVVGEIFVRRDGLARQGLSEYLADQGFVVRVAHASEWFKYVDYMIENRWEKESHVRGLAAGMMHRLKTWLQDRIEKAVVEDLSASGLLEPVVDDVAEFMEAASPYISPNLTGEAILTVGSAFRETLRRYSGAIALGPFGCMPNRIAEAVLSVTMSEKYKRRLHPRDKRMHEVLKDVPHIPFLAIETDGNPYPSVIRSNLEVFCLRARQAGEAMRKAGIAAAAPHRAARGD
ncbi:MAG: acyl-CoA dehydratase activase-related protein, partial [Planctomycetota bacterium]|nr:acyl-CoA dehydratase activase-related protein [Planctomycetota bacterium]